MEQIENKSQSHRAEATDKHTVLYDSHIKLAEKSHIVPFGGFLCPMWFSSIGAEHRAVREAAGIFDCTHMGVLELSGAGAGEFLDELATNNVANLEIGRAQYSFILDASGHVLDDFIIFRTGAERFMLVVNAVNNARIKDWIRSLLSDEVCIDPEHRERKVSGTVGMRDLRLADSGEDCRVDIALQGPKSLDVLFALTGDEESRSEISELKPFGFVETAIDEVDCLLSRTGYTGEKLGFELFVHPEKALQVWEAALDAGRPLGLVPCGLGARDSLRIEAGFPLYGHELGGDFDISPFEAGYGWAVKLDKEFFIGKAAIERTAETYSMKVARIRLPGAKGIRPVRANDGVVSSEGQCLGWVSSCARVGEEQFALAYVDREMVKEDDSVGVYYTARSKRQAEKGIKQSVEKGDRLESDVAGTVVSRFRRSKKS